MLSWLNITILAFSHITMYEYDYFLFYVVFCSYKWIISFTVTCPILGWFLNRAGKIHPETALECKVIQDLPEELILYIFSFLSPTDLCMSVAKVCSTWQDFAYAPTLWKSLEYKCHGDQRIDERNEIFVHAPCLGCLTIASSGCVDTSTLLSALKGRVLPVTELILHGRRLGSEFYRDVAE